MKIAFTHNLQLSNSEEEAEFDRPETVAEITENLRSLGHIVEPIDIAGPASRIVARIEALNPDLVFNTAEGTQGRFREAFYPALFDHLNLPFTGSDAYVCALTLDKHLTKMVVTAHGIPTPRWIFVNDIRNLDNITTGALRYPLIVKPNFEGSSKGIHSDSVVENAEALLKKAESLLRIYPAGIIIEEFIKGRDLTVPYLEKASSGKGGVLEPAMYSYDRPKNEELKYQIYDYEMKSVYFDNVHVHVPAKITKEQKNLVQTHTKRIINAIGIRDLCRIDFRIGDDNEIYFIEVNALPSLETGSSLYISSAHAGLKTPAKVLDAVVNSAAERFGLDIALLKTSKRKQTLLVGLTFNLKHNGNGTALKTGDDEAEFDSPETVSAIKGAIESYGHKVVELEATPELPSILPGAGVDLVFNVAEGFDGRSREAHVPALLDLLGIPYTGSDATTLSLALDKALAKRLVNEAGLNTPPFLLMSSGKERLPKNLTFPVIVKPFAEGSSKGILSRSVVENESELRELVSETANKYKQAVIAESYLPGREFTIALIGEKRPKALPPLEVIFTDNSRKFPIYSYDTKLPDTKAVTFEVPAKIDMKLQKEIERYAKSVFSILGCRDFARVDFRLDENGKVNFMECNPLPGLTPDFSDFCVIAKAAGISYRSLIGEIMAPAIRRLREKNREKLFGGRA